MTRVLLTGAGGFVGHHCLEHLLLNTDWEIVCLDSFRHRGKTDRIREVVWGHDEVRSRGEDDWRRRIKVLTHDLRVPISRQLDEEIGYVNYVLSVASDSHVDRSITDPREFIENNVALVLTMLEWVRSRNGWTFDPPQKFLHVSTDEVYGPAPVGHDHVEGEPHRPSNPYSASKAAQEDIVYSYWRTYGLPLGVSNTMNIIGERQDPEKFVPLVLSKVARGETVEIHAGRGPTAATWPADEPAPLNQPGSRFYLHARNQADALLFLLREVPFPCYGDRDPVFVVKDRGSGETSWDPKTEKAAIFPTSDEAESWRKSRKRARDLDVIYDELASEMGRWNVVGEREIDNLAMAELIAQYAGLDLRYELVDFHSSRPGHDLRYALDGTKLAGLGWTPPMPLEESLASTVRWTLDHRHWLL
jgi:dTDP-glucose 4,6-dehydratase